MNTQINLYEKKQVVEHLNSVCKSTAAIVIDKISYAIIKKRMHNGDRNVKYITADTVSNLLTAELYDNVKANVELVVGNPEEYYYINA